MIGYKFGVYDCWEKLLQSGSVFLLERGQFINESIVDLYIVVYLHASDLSSHCGQGEEFYFYGSTTRSH